MYYKQRNNKTLVVAQLILHKKRLVLCGDDEKSFAWKFEFIDKKRQRFFGNLEQLILCFINPKNQLLQEYPCM